MATYSADEISKMNQMLRQADVVLLIDPYWTKEEFETYIIHMFSVFICTMSWVDREETVNIIYALRNSRGQKWIDSYKP